MMCNIVRHKRQITDCYVFRSTSQNLEYSQDILKVGNI